MVKESIIAGNTAAFAGGIDCCWGDALYIADSVLVGNVATSADSFAGVGGAIYSFDATVIITNSTITGNVGSEGGGVYCRGATIDAYNTLVALNSGGDVRGDWIGSTSLVGIDPAFERNPFPGADGFWVLRMTTMAICASGLQVRRSTPVIMALRCGRTARR